MKFNFITLLVLISIAFTQLSCKTDKPSGDSLPKNAIVIGVASDLDNINPLLINLSLSREVCTLIFPTLVRPKFNESTGELSYSPSLATRWTFSEDGKNATFFLRSEAVWEDGKPVTSADLKFSYQLYLNPAVASTRQHYVADLQRNASGEIDFEKAVETPNDTTLILHFNKPLAPDIILDHFYDLMPVAKHVFEKIDPKELRSRAPETPILGGGPYKVTKWTRQQELVLEASPSSKIPHPGKIEKLIFRVIPEYTTRLTLLKTGQLDVMMSAGGINPKDADAVLQGNPDLVIRPVRNRSFDSIVWLNIDGDAYREKGEIKPNFFFGDKRVRQAMTYAINREAIVDGFMGAGHATIVNTSISPAYTSVIDTTLDPYACNPDKARELLKACGWSAGPDGILQKDGRKFSFTLVAPTGNARRNYAATVVQQNLKDLGIECKLEFAETVVFVKNQNEYRYDAALSGLSAETLPFQLIIWGSDFTKSTFNSSAFQNKRLDEVISQLGTALPKEDNLRNWHEYQRILHDEQPRTFLYYFDELEGFSKRIQNADVSMLAVLLNAYDWELK